MNNIFNQNYQNQQNLSLQREKDNFNQGPKAAITNNFQQKDNIETYLQINLPSELCDAMKWTEQFDVELQKLKTTLMRKLDQALYCGRAWQESIIEIVKQHGIFLQDGMEIHTQQQTVKRDYKELIQHINTSYLEKIINAFEYLKKEIQENKLQLLFNEFYYQQQQIQKKETNKEQYKFINQIDQKEICYSIAFDRQRTIMVSGSQDEIKIWRFQDGKKIECIQQIKGDSEIDYATCLIFSQKTNCFISGSYDSSIKLYYNQNNKWFKMACKTSHSGLVTCVILNNQEDQLISCSKDFSIFIWKLNLTQKSIQFDYSLNRHEKVVLSLCINQSDTEFVSTGQDQKLIIWKKNANQKWSFNQLIDHSYSDVGCRVTYITDTIIVWQQSNQPYIHFFQLLNGMYVEKQSIQFQQPESQTETYQFLFPTIYNRENQVLIHKFNKKIYFIRFDDDTQQYKVDSRSIECSSSAVFGNATQDGKFLVIWDSFLKVYELFYE